MGGRLIIATHISQGFFVLLLNECVVLWTPGTALLCPCCQNGQTSNEMGEFHHLPERAGFYVP